MRGAAGKVYADALFALSEETNTTEAVQTALCEAEDIFRTNPALYQLLSVPTIATAEKLQLVKKIFAGQEFVLSLLCMLTERNRIQSFPQVCAAFAVRYRALHHIAEMTVTTSVPLTDALRERLLAKLRQQSGMEVHLTERVDASILGGVVVQYGNTVLDSSIQTRLESMRKQLRQA